AAFRSSAMVGCLRLAPFGLPLCPGLNWYSRGGRPGPTLYSWSTVFVFAATGSLVFCSIFMPRSGGDRAGGALCRDRLEGFTRVGEHGRLAAIGLPAAHRDVDIGGIDLKRPRLPAGLFGCDQNGAAAAKGVEHQAAAARAILERVRDQCDRLDRWVHGELLQPSRTHAVDAG